jgi:hypothetical protein
MTNQSQRLAGVSMRKRLKCAITDRVYIAVHVPAAESDLDKARALVGSPHLFRNQAGVSESAVAVPLTIAIGKFKGLIHSRVIHHAFRCAVEVVVVLRIFSQRGIHAQWIIQRVQQVPPVGKPARAAPASSTKITLRAVFFGVTEASVTSSAARSLSLINV